VQLTAAEIAERAAGHVVGDADARALSWAFDSRALVPGACFVALRGDRDGHDFVPDALRAGAHVALVDRDLPGVRPTRGQALVRVGDTLAGLQQVARSVRRDRQELRVVGVAGSSGKTSAKDLLAAALELVPVHANAESYNNEFGLPITLLNAPAAVVAVVTELGERFPGDVAALCEIARPCVGLVTNVGLAHAEYLEGPEGVARALAELLEALPVDGLAVLNADDAWTPWLAERSVAPVTTVGHSVDADHRITDVEIDGTLFPSFALGSERFAVPLRGVHQVENAAMAAVVAHDAFGLSWGDVALCMRNARGARWRMELLETADGVTVLNDAYNANPSSMEAALRALAHLSVPGRRIAVLGEMRELGGHADDAHADAGSLAAALHVDVVIGVAGGGEAIARAASAGVPDVRTVADAAGALAAVAGLVRKGDAVLVKASRALGLQAVAEGLMSR
jgi:UDP-N-acetylmuramoyl-tripeptide--D-alanyl-D-alanine ligase